MEKIGKIFAKNLKELRASRNQVDVAAEVGVSLRAWQRMEKGSLPKSPGTITAIADYFRVPESRLFQDPDLRIENNPTPAEALKVIEKAIQGKPQTKERRLRVAEPVPTEKEALLAALEALDETSIKWLRRQAENLRAKYARDSSAENDGADEA